MFFFSASNQQFILPRSKVYVFFSHNNHVCRHHRPCLFIIKAEFYMHPRKRRIHSNSSIYQPKYALQYMKYYYTSVIIFYVKLRRLNMYFLSNREIVLVLSTPGEMSTKLFTGGIQFFSVFKLGIPLT